MRLLRFNSSREREGERTQMSSTATSTLPCDFDTKHEGVSGSGESPLVLLCVLVSGRPLLWRCVKWSSKVKNAAMFTRTKMKNAN